MWAVVLHVDLKGEIRKQLGLITIQIITHLGQDGRAVCRSAPEAELVDPYGVGGPGGRQAKVVVRGQVQKIKRAHKCFWAVPISIEVEHNFGPSLFRARLQDEGNVRPSVGQQGVAVVGLVRIGWVVGDDDRAGEVARVREGQGVSYIVAEPLNRGVRLSFNTNT